MGLAAWPVIVCRWRLHLSVFSFGLVMLLHITVWYIATLGTVGQHCVCRKAAFPNINWILLLPSALPTSRLPADFLWLISISSSVIDRDLVTDDQPQPVGLDYKYRQWDSSLQASQHMVQVMQHDTGTAFNVIPKNQIMNYGFYQTLLFLLRISLICSIGRGRWPPT